MEKLQNLNSDYFRQASELLAELDALIERDYQEALTMLEEFKKGTIILKDELVSENLENSLQLDIFEEQKSSKYHEYSNR